MIIVANGEFNKLWKQEKFEMRTILNEVKEALVNSIDPKNLTTSDRFFKEGEAAKVHGVKMGDVGKIAKHAFQQIKHLPNCQI